MVMENAALNAIKPYLDADESALGTRVDVRHLAATPAGRCVTGEARVIGVEGRRIEFSIRATDGDAEVGVGTHERMVIHLPKFAERMKASSARTQAGLRASNTALEVIRLSHERFLQNPVK